MLYSTKSCPDASVQQTLVEEYCARGLPPLTQLLVFQTLKTSREQTGMQYTSSLLLLATVDVNKERREMELAENDYHAKVNQPKPSYAKLTPRKHILTSCKAIPLCSKEVFATKYSGYGETQSRRHHPSVRHTFLPDYVMAVYL